MWPDRVSNPGPLNYESGALPTALRGPAHLEEYICHNVEGSKQESFMIVQEHFSCISVRNTKS